MAFYIKLVHRIAFAASIVGLIVLIGNFGFAQPSISHEILLYRFYCVVLIVGIVSTTFRYISDLSRLKRKVFVFDLLTISFTIILLYAHFVNSPAENWIAVFANKYLIDFSIFFTFIREFSEVRVNYKRTFLNPAQLFIASFLGIILIGTALLMLPNATNGGIPFINALFTSTSAVCVTGLTVVDTATHFTLFGQIIIMLLIQVGGLGILTFASYFSYFFRGGSTYENQLALGDLTSSNKLGEVFSTLKYILLVTFGIELVAALLIYVSLDTRNFNSQWEQIFFAVFHAISSFCNAGFSTLSNSLSERGFEYNYALHLAIIFTFFLGALGFPIVVNMLSYLRYKISILLSFSKRRKNYKPWVLNLNSRLSLITTLAIVFIAFIFFFLLEYNNTLANHHGLGKVVTALFAATTPRSAGLNTIDTSAMTFPVIMMVSLLMWIGGSPQSTAGGIKTSTFAIATLNILSLAKGKSRIEVFGREIANISVKRAFAIISLSLIAIGLGVTLISVFDAEKAPADIAFECFSAYSTTGLSLGITGDLSSPSKFVIIVLMFVGRVSMLSLMIAVFKKAKHKNYSYPKEEITIN